MISYCAITFGSHDCELNSHLVQRNVTIRYEATQLIALSGLGGQRILRPTQFGPKPRHLLERAIQLFLELETGFLVLRLLAVCLVQAVGQLVAFSHQPFSRLVHLLAYSGDLTIGFLLCGMTRSHSPEKFGLQMRDHGGLVDPVGQRLPKGLGLLDLVVIANAQAVVLRLDKLDERGRGGAELLNILTQLAILDHLPLQSSLHTPVLIHDSLLEVQANVKRINRCV